MSATNLPPSQALFDRRCKLTISRETTTGSTTTTDTLEIDGGKTDRSDSPGLRIQFKIAASTQKEPNTSQVTITNLSENRRQSLQSKGQTLRLECGYSGTRQFQGTGLQQFFTGDIRTIDHVRDGADWNTVLKLGDGERIWKYARVNESFGENTEVAAVIRRLAEATGLGMGNVNDYLNKNVHEMFKQGWSATGSASRALDKALNAIRLNWSIQNGAIYLRRSGEYLDIPIPEIAPDSGLIGSPEMGNPARKGGPALLKFKSLLLPAVPGARVKLKSERYNGYVVALKVTHVGDTSGQDWYSEIDGEISM